VVKAGYHPPTCQVYARNGGAAHCQVCPHNGRVGVSSPLSLGQDDSDLPDTYRRQANAVEKMCGRTAEGEPEWRVMVPVGIKDVRALEVYDPSVEDEKPELWLAFEVWQGTFWKPTKVPLAALNIGVVNDLGTVMHQANIGITKLAQLQAAKEAFMDWLTHLRQIQRIEAVPRYTLFGWVIDDAQRAGFAFGRTVYLRGKPPGRIESSDDAVRQKYIPTGRIEPWRAHVDLLRQNGGSIDLHIAVAAAFAAPLVDLTPVRGLVVNLHSPETGSGKTTALEAAQAVWGHPHKGALTVDDTENAVANHMGIVRNLPVIWDEVRTADNGERLSQLIFRVSQGKERARLNSTSERQRGGSWSTTVLIGSNVPVEDVMEQHAGENLAGLSRVFSLRVPRLPDDNPPVDWPDLTLNFGRAGEVYAAWLVENVEQVQQAISKLRIRVTEKLGGANSERFWRETIVTIMAGCWAAKAAGIYAFDAPAIYQRLLGAVESMRDIRSGMSGNEAGTATETDEGRALRLLREYISAHPGGVVRTTTMGTGGGGPNIPKPVLLSALPMRDPLIAQIATEEFKLRVLRAPFGAWLQKHKKGKGTTYTALTAMFGAPFLGALGTRTDVATPYGHLWEIDLTLDSARTLYSLVGSTAKLNPAPVT
jgi:hypothetical protein